jgi:hypothetical protein
MSNGIFNGVAYECLDREGRMTWLDGWHQTLGMGFTTSRDMEGLHEHTGVHGEKEQLRGMKVLNAGVQAGDFAIKQREEAKKAAEAAEASDE